MSKQVKKFYIVPNRRNNKEIKDLIVSVKAKIAQASNIKIELTSLKAHKETVMTVRPIKG